MRTVQELIEEVEREEVEKKLEGQRVLKEMEKNNRDENK